MRDIRWLKQKAGKSHLYPQSESRGRLGTLKAPSCDGLSSACLWLPITFLNITWVPSAQVYETGANFFIHTMTVSFWDIIESLGGGIGWQKYMFKNKVPACPTDWVPYTFPDIEFPECHIAYKNRLKSPGTMSKFNLFFSSTVPLKCLVTTQKQHMEIISSFPFDFFSLLSRIAWFGQAV